MDKNKTSKTKWTTSSDFGTYCLCEQQRFRRACASAQSRQNLRCSLIQAVSQEEPSVRKPDPWPLWMAGHAQLKFVMTECSRTQICLTGLKCCIVFAIMFALLWYSYSIMSEISDIIDWNAHLSNLTSLWNNIFYLCPINSFKLLVQVYFMLGIHQIVTTVLLSLYRSDISLYRGENWYVHYKIAILRFPAFHLFICLSIHPVFCVSIKKQI